MLVLFTKIHPIIYIKLIRANSCFRWHNLFFCKPISDWLTREFITDIHRLIAVSWQTRDKTRGVAGSQSSETKQTSSQNGSKMAKYRSEVLKQKPLAGDMNLIKIIDIISSYRTSGFIFLLVCKSQAFIIRTRPRWSRRCLAEVTIGEQPGDCQNFQFTRLKLF